MRGVSATLRVSGGDAGADRRTSLYLVRVQSRLFAAGGGAFRTAQRTGAAIDFDAGEYLPLYLARICMTSSARFSRRSARCCSAPDAESRRRPDAARRISRRCGRSCNPRSTRFARCRRRCIRWCWTKPGSKARSMSYLPGFREADGNRGTIREERTEPRAWIAMWRFICIA